MQRDGVSFPNESARFDGIVFKLDPQTVGNSVVVGAYVSELAAFV